MELSKALKILSSESKLKIITMFIYCKCGHYTVSDLCEVHKLQQANMSKHLSNLNDEGVLDFVKDGKEVHYKINEEFRKEYADLIDVIAKKDPKNIVCPTRCKTCEKQ